MSIDAAIADLAHHVHAHGIAAEGKEGSVTQAENAAIPPNQIDAESKQREAQIFPEQAQQIVRNVERRVHGHQLD